MSSVIDLAVIGAVGFGAYWLFNSQTGKAVDDVLSNSAKNFEKIQEGVGWAMDQIGYGVQEGGKLFVTGVGQGVQLAGQGISQLDTLVKNTTNVGEGTPVELQSCPAGWTNDGLTCREPIRCAEGWDFFSQGCSGGRVTGRLDSGGVCSGDKEKIDGLCYNRCPAGYNRVAGMPYLCRK